MKRLAPIVLIALSVFLSETQYAQTSNKSTQPLIVIKAGRVIDPVSGNTLNDQIIIVKGEIIEAIGSGVPIPIGAKIIDLSSATVLPGLIDCHVHIISQAVDQRIITDPYIDPAIIAHVYAKRTLLSGFTSIRNLGSLQFADVSLKRAIEAQLVDGPRIQPASYYIGSTGSHGDQVGGSPWGGSLLPSDMSGIADGVEAVRKKVRYLIKNGADVIKFGASAGVLSNEDSVAAPQYTQDEMDAIVSEAHMWGRRVAAHAHGSEAIKMAIRAGVDSIEHGSLIDDEGIRMMREKGTYLVADIYVDDYILAEFAKFGVSEKIIAKEKLVGLAQRQNFQKAARAGVKIAFGTDAGVYPHGWNAKQFSVMVKWGLTPMEAIRSATISAADLLGWSESVGSVSAGKYADIIAVSGDPIKDVSILEDVRFVMKGGKVYKDEFSR